MRKRGDFAKILKRALRAATGRAWSVTSGHGTARMLTYVDAPRKRIAEARAQGMRMLLEDRRALAEIFDFACTPSHVWGGLSIDSTEQEATLWKVLEAVLRAHPTWTREQLARGEFPP